MAISRSAFEAIGTFDPGLGAGTALFAGEEFDLTIRALAAGLKVVETPHMTVLAPRRRTGRDASQLMRGYGVGFGAAFLKHVRLRTPGALRRADRIVRPARLAKPGQDAARPPHILGSVCSPE